MNSTSLRQALSEVEGYIHQDHLTGTSVITDTNGASVGTMKYHPFGETRSGSVPTDKLFTGQRLDETGLYYYGGRYYDATIGKFISADPFVPQANGVNIVSYQLTINMIPLGLGTVDSPQTSSLKLSLTVPLNPQTLNRYSYVLNNPLKWVDPTGFYEAYHDGQTDYPSQDYITYNGDDTWNATVGGEQQLVTTEGFKALIDAYEEHGASKGLSWNQFLGNEPNSRSSGPDLPAASSKGGMTAGQAFAKAGYMFLAAVELTAGTVLMVWGIGVAVGITVETGGFGWMVGLAAGSPFFINGYRIFDDALNRLTFGKLDLPNIPYFPRGVIPGM